MPRFVVLRHEYAADDPRESHWDLMLEHGELLRTWACSVAPESCAETIVRELDDHRLAYLEYEGPVSEDRGQVRRWDEGFYETVRDEAGQLVIQFDGQKLRGGFALERLSDEPQRWRFGPADC